MAAMPHAVCLLASPTCTIGAVLFQPGKLSVHTLLSWVWHVTNASHQQLASRQYAGSIYEASCLLGVALQNVADKGTSQCFTMPCRKAGKRFRVVVLDARPHHEGRALLRHLLAAGLCASYCLLNAAAYIFSEVTKVRPELRLRYQGRGWGQP